MRKATLAISAFLGLLLLVVAACGGSYDDDSGGPAGGDAVGVPRGGVGDAADEAPGNSIGSGGEQSGGTGSQSLLDRKIVRTATLELTVENVGTGVADVERIATTAGGFVSSSNLTIENPNGDESERRQVATLTIRIPSSSYASVMSELRGVADEVTSETSTASEVTEEYTDLQSRLRTLEATESRYLDLLSQAETIDEILTVQDRLNTVVSEIEQVKGRMGLLDGLTDLATITVELNPPLAPGLQPSESKGWAQEAWDTAWATSEDALKVFGTIGIGLGVLAIWLVIPGAMGLIGWRLYERRKASGGAA